MAEIIPAGISGGAISQGQGQGWAQDLGRSSFDGVTFINNLNAERAQRRKQLVDDEIATRARNAKNKPVAPESNRHNEEEIYRLSDELNNQFAKAQAAGIDLMGTPEGMKIIAQGERELKKAKVMGDLVAEREKHYQDLYNANPGKYSVEELNKWQEGLNKTRGIANKAKYVEENEPFTPQPLDLNEIIADIKIDPTVIQTGLKTVSQIDNPAAKEVFADHIRSMELENPGSGTAIYEAGLKPNALNGGKPLWTNMEEMYTFGGNRIQKLGGYKETFGQPQSSGKGGGITVNVGGGVENDKFRVTPTVSPDIPGASSGNNIIHINSTSGNEMKPMEFSVDGQPTFMKLADLQKTQGHVGKSEYQKIVAEANELGKIKNKTPEQAERIKQLQNKLSHKERWVIKGTKAKRITGEQVNAAKKKLGDENFFASYQEVDDEPGTYVSITENEPIDVPISSIKGEKGYENFKKLVGITGIPEKQLAEMMGEGGGSTNKGTTDSDIIDLD